MFVHYAVTPEEWEETDLRTYVVQVVVSPVPRRDGLGRCGAVAASVDAKEQLFHYLRELYIKTIARDVAALELQRFVNELASQLVRCWISIRVRPAVTNISLAIHTRLVSYLPCRVLDVYMYIREKGPSTCFKLFDIQRDI